MLIAKNNLLRVVVTYIQYFRNFKSKSKIKYGTLPKLSNIPQTIHIIDEKLINCLVDIISDDLKNEKSLIVEVNPGPGFLTEALLKANVPRLRCFSSTDTFASKFDDLRENYPTRLECFNINVLHLEKLVNEEIEFKEKWVGKGFLSGIEHRNWKDPPPIKMIVPLSPSIEIPFLRSIFNQLCHQTSFFSFGRTQLIVTVSIKELSNMNLNKNLNSRKTYRSSCVFYKTMFDIEHINTFQWDAFLPLVVLPKSPQKYKESLNEAFLIRLTPKADIIDKLKPELWPDFLFFLRQTMFKNTNYIIPYLENWIPFCGPKLIKQGYPLFKQFKSLSPLELLDLFLEISQWPEYCESNFRAASNVLLKQREEEEEEEEKEEKDEDEDEDEEDEKKEEEKAEEKGKKKKKKIDYQETKKKNENELENYYKDNDLDECLLENSKISEDWDNDFDNKKDDLQLS